MARVGQLEVEAELATRSLEVCDVHDMMFT